MKQIKILLITSIVICSFSSYAQWTEVNTISSKFIQKLNFLTDEIGYTLMKESTGQGVTIEKTIDGGNNWTIINMPVSEGEIQDIYFNSDEEGVAVVRNLNNNVTPTKIYHTLNDGTSWQDISPDITVTGIGNAQCQFLDQNTGFLSTGEKLYTTIDGGANWNTYELPGIATSMDFMDANHGTIGLFDGTFNYFGGMMTTSDGGVTWNVTQLTENQTVVGEVIQIDENIAYAAPVKWGAANQLKFFKTSDNGSNWDTILVPGTLPNSSLSDIDFKDEMNGVISISNFDISYIYNTEDGGITWVFQDSINWFTISDLELTPNSGYLSGAVGAFYKLLGTTSLKQEIETTQLSLFPNPVKSGQSISWNSTETFTDLTIIDLSGRIIHRQSLQQHNISIPNLIAGVYLIRLQNEEIIKIVKLVIE